MGNKELTNTPNPKPETKVHKDPLTALLLPSVVGILICMFLLCGATRAWFTSTQNGATATVKSADYTIAVQVKDGENTVILTDNTFTASGNTEYTVTLTTGGTASTGFCKITVADATAGSTKTLYTAQLAQGQTMTFTVNLSASATVTFSPQWGTSSKSTAPDITTGTAVAD